MTSSEIRKGRKPTLVSIYGSLNPEDVQRLNKSKRSSNRIWCLDKKSAIVDLSGRAERFDAITEEFESNWREALVGARSGALEKFWFVG